MTIEATRPTIPHASPSPDPSTGSPSPAPAKHRPSPITPSPGRDQTTPQPIPDATPRDLSAAGSQTSRDHHASETQSSSVPAAGLPGDHGSVDAHRPCVAGEHDQDRPAARELAKPIEHSSLADPFLALAADVVDDLEKVRIANENRLRQLTRSVADKDGAERGFGLTEDHPDVARLAALVDMLGEAEHKAVLNLGRLLRQHPLGPWIKAQVGLGEKQAARLLAAIGDPYWNTLHDRPRTVSELWAYCGYHVLPAGHPRSDDHTSAVSGIDFPADHSPNDAQNDLVGGEQTGHPGHRERDDQATSAGVAAKRARGQKANWSATAKMRAYLIAESCVKQRSSPYRKVYDDTREHYADAVHNVACVRCGPAGKPAPAGSPLSDGHKHARALRAVSKAVLKDLWREARRIHIESQGAA